MNQRHHLLVLDNYDSFTYNLVHYLEQVEVPVTVHRNDAIPLSAVAEYSHIVISPGPGLPRENGITPALIERYAAHKPILGICLGCQALAEAAGGILYRQARVAHGIARPMQRGDSRYLWRGLSANVEVGLYHSWAIRATPAMEQQYRLAGFREDGSLMAIEHRQWPLAGLQFHPESVLSSGGMQMLRNWFEHSLST